MLFEADFDERLTHSLSSSRSLSAVCALLQDFRHFEQCPVAVFANFVADLVECCVLKKALNRRRDAFEVRNNYSISLFRDPLRVKALLW
jgi:hypothetical protein